MALRPRPKSVRLRAAQAAALAIGGLALVAAPALVATPASAAGATVVVSGSLAEGPTTLGLTGSGFQSIEGGFGGIYVLFGTVSGNWKPSAGGVGGRDFLYVPDAQTKDNAGREKFVAFPGSETADTANGGTVAADGTWSTSIEVPGPVFEVVDAAGKAVEVDCHQVQCGVITIGAHGVVNANNETFTPVGFGSDAAGSGSTQDASGADTQGGAEAEETSIVAAGPATVGVDATTAVAGHALAFTARGFTPGEQITAVLDDGEVSVGPLTAGQFGEVAATIALAPDLRVGSHTLTVTGAASGTVAEAMITVRRDPSLVEASPQSQQVGADRKLDPWEIAIVVAAIVFVLVLVGSLTAAFATRRARRARGAATPEADEPGLGANMGAKT